MSPTVQRAGASFADYSNIWAAQRHEPRTSWFFGEKMMRTILPHTQTPATGSPSACKCETSLSWQVLPFSLLDPEVLYDELQ